MGRFVTPVGGGNLMINSPNFGALTAAPYTMACWEYLSRSGNSDIYQMVQGKLALYVWNNQLFFHLYTNEVFGGTVPDQAWTHCAGTYDGTNLRAWINGTNVASTTCTETLPNHVYLDIGWCPAADRNHYGVVSDVAIWNVVLTSDELAALARGVSPMRIRPNAIILYVPCLGARRLEDPTYVEPDLAPNGGSVAWSQYAGTGPNFGGGPRMPPVVGLLSPAWRPMAFIPSGPPTSYTLIALPGSVPIRSGGGQNLVLSWLYRSPAIQEDTEIINNILAGHDVKFVQYRITVADALGNVKNTYTTTSETWTYTQAMNIADFGVFSPIVQITIQVLNNDTALSAGVTNTYQLLS